MTVTDVDTTWSPSGHAPAHVTAPEWDETDGDLARELAADLGWELDTVQQWTVDQALAVHADGDRPACRETAIVGPRQTVGKSVALEVLALFDVLIADVELHVWTAHLYSTALKTYADMKRRLERHRDYASRCEYREGNTDRAIIVDDDRRIEFHTRSTGKGGRGFPGVKRITLDEWLFGKPADLGALAPTMVTQRDAQIRYASSAGKVESQALRDVEKRGRAGTDGRLAYVELAAPRTDCAAGPACLHPKQPDPGEPYCALNDRALWWESNSGLWRTGPGRVYEDAIADQRQLLDAAEFAREFLGWEEVPPSEMGGDLDVDRFAALANPDAARGRPVYFGVAVAPDRSWSAVAVAWRRPGGGVHVQSVAYRPHASWLTDRVVELRRAWGGTVVVDSRARDLIPDAREPSEVDQALAEAALSDAVIAGTLTHGNEPELLTAVGSAVWQQAGAQRRLVSSGSIDVTPIKAAALAVHAASQVVDPLAQVW